MSRKIIFGILILTLLFLFLTGCSNKPAQVNTDQPQQQQQGQATGTKFSLDEIAKHNSSNDCWIAISGKVYDVTSAIASHTGGDLILQGCGKDATAMVEAKPAHSTDKSKQNLENLYIGEVQ